jgi:hypothetical protein
MPSPSKIRRRNRARQKSIDTYETLKLEGRSCASCSSFTSDMQRDNKYYCETHSDSCGVSYVSPQHLCVKWNQKLEIVIITNPVDGDNK